MTPMPPKPPPPDEVAGPAPPLDPVEMLPQPLDLEALLTGERPDLDWIVEPLAAAGKLVGIVAKRGEGKSLLSLDLAAAAATGTACLDQPDGPPVPIVYIDMEMGPDDLYERLIDLGYGPDHPRFDALLGHLHYYQLPSLPPLDTEAGGRMLERIAELHGARLVIIDTVSRVISGSENDAEPFLELFRHTETRLKRRGIGVLRLDHFGKDAAKGSRGHSAKEDPLDVVWEMSVERESVTLKRTKGRQAGTPDAVHLTRSDAGGRLTHRVSDSAPITAKATEVVRLLDDLGVPVGVSVNEAQAALKAANEGKGRPAIVEAVRWRKNARKTVPNRPGEPQPGTMPGTTPEPPGTAGNRLLEPGPPPKGGTGARPGQNPCDGCGRQAERTSSTGKHWCEACWTLHTGGEPWPQ
ncbi:MAG: AAA family ATPase [Nitriliruptoraceae bacterium]|nr:AAA family ATPase [Nitriliruptoraceae bacterium]